MNRVRESFCKQILEMVAGCIPDNKGGITLPLSSLDRKPEIWKCGFSECKHFATPFVSTSSGNRIGDWLKRGRAEGIAIARQHRNYEGKQAQEEA